MTIDRRSFLAALAGLPVLGRVLQRAPLPTDEVIVTSGYANRFQFGPDGDPEFARFPYDLTVTTNNTGGSMGTTTYAPLTNITYTTG